MIWKNGRCELAKVHYNGKIHLVELQPEIHEALKVMDLISQEETDNEIIITCGVEGYHSRTSKHPKGYAADLRTRIYTDKEKAVLMRKWNKRLNPLFNYDTNKGQKNYDIIHESIGTGNEHFHVEYDPHTNK